MSRWTQVLLGLSLLLNAFVLAGFIYRSWIMPPAFERPVPPPGSRPSTLELVAQDVNMDEGQRQALKGVFDTYAAQRRDRQRDSQKLREQIAEEYRKPTVDMARVETLIDQLTDQRAESQKESLRALAALEAGLRPDQRERLNQIVADRLANPPWMQRPPGSAPRPGPGRPSQ